MQDNRQSYIKGQGNLVCGNILTYQKQFDLLFVKALIVTKMSVQKNHVLT